MFFDLCPPVPMGKELTGQSLQAAAHELSPSRANPVSKAAPFSVPKGSPCGSEDAGSCNRHTFNPELTIKQMNDKTAELLNGLAVKFGTTVEHLWGVLVRQAAITAATEVIVSLGMVSLWVWAFRFVKEKTKQKEAGKYSSPEAEWEDEGAFLAWFCIAVGLLVVVIQVGCAASVITAALFNPEYWALKQLLP